MSLPDCKNCCKELRVVTILFKDQEELDLFIKENQYLFPLQDRILQIAKVSGDTVNKVLEEI